MKFENQVGGKAKITKIFEGHLLKPTNIREVTSYLNLPLSVADIAPECCFIVSNGEVISIKQCDSECKPLEVVQELMKSQPEKYYLILKDATHNMKQPRILDMKLGTRTYGDHITEEKKKHHVLKSKSNTTFSLGLRLCGGSFFDSEDGQMVNYSRAMGHSLSEPEFINLVKKFLTVSKQKKDVAIAQLLKVKEVIEACPTFRFFGSSLLVMADDYDETSIKIKLIDFANMARSELNQPQYAGIDEGAVLGINNLIKLLE
uniref:Kinase n=1 Tax=Caenorhabditis tropicalis TaxID=1561998 RepID=A0A1I7TLL0_9PELO